MWTEYKKEIIAQNKEGKSDFLKRFYHNNLLISGISTAIDKKTDGIEVIERKESNTSTVSSIPRDESLSIVLDSDEEPPTVIPKDKTGVSRKKKVGYFRW